jgi:UDP-N-acetylmuramyl pentapeptide phosphotransferase/UDP-N-acetylglucosamine-1-phosphate transferase
MLNNKESKDSMVRWGIGLLGAFIIPPIISFLLGIAFFTYASTETKETKRETIRTYGGYFILIGICAYVMSLFHL